MMWNGVSISVAVELDQQGNLLRCEHLENVVWGW